MSLILWAVVPYVSMTMFVVGHIWRYKHDKFGWTTRTTQVLEKRLLRRGMYLFHGGLFGAFGGHVIGLMIPEHWTTSVGISEEVYHVMSASMGLVMGLCTVTGLGILIYRRWTVPAVAQTTTRSDRIMYVLLSATILLGTSATFRNTFWTAHDYRQTVSPWFRSVLTLHPEVELMTSVPIIFQLHILVAMVFLAYWPFTRLVHALSAPVGYLTRPYIVYRKRGSS